MKFLEGMVAVIVGVIAILGAAFLAIVVVVRLLIMPIIAVCLIILAYRALTG